MNDLNMTKSGNTVTLSIKHGYRGMGPDLTEEQIQGAVPAARAWLGAAEGQMQVSNMGTSVVFTYAPAQSRTMV